MKKWYLDWVEVFRSGTHTDSRGITRTWSNDDLDSIVRNYNKDNNEAPVVIGHPAADAPAFGWVDKIKRANDRLLVKFTKLAPEFINWVDSGLYRKISIAINNDKTLRHVGFLGAAPPAVKGLRYSFGASEDYSLYNDEPLSSEFSDLRRNYDALLLQTRRLEAEQFISKLCEEGKINKAYAPFLQSTLCMLDNTPSNAFCDCEDSPANLMREFLSTLPPRCTFKELATQPPKRPLAPETEAGLRIAKSY